MTPRSLMANTTHHQEAQNPRDLQRTCVFGFDFVKTTVKRPLPTLLDLLHLSLGTFVLH